LAVVKLLDHPLIRPLVARLRSRKADLPLASQFERSYQESQARDLDTNYLEPYETTSGTSASSNGSLSIISLDGAGPRSGFSERDPL
jgi:hypothetical protein